ncbi:hypothetical protein BgiBS90_016018 [Biomphalaria glabrata]|nr:hypothetical protein BgiBS90_016018 [Biomphalaria glabrata]
MSQRSIADGRVFGYSDKRTNMASPVCYSCVCCSCSNGVPPRFPKLRKNVYLSYQRRRVMRGDLTNHLSVDLGEETDMGQIDSNSEIERRTTTLLLRRR